MLSSLPRSRRRRSRGTVLLEFMLILPLFIFMTLFAVDMGRMILVAGAMNDAAYVSARAGAQRGSAGNADDGASRRAFERAVATIPGASGTDTTNFAVVQGNCTTEESYIVIEVSQQVDLITPGLGGLLGIVGSGTGPDTTGGFELRSRGAVLCEVIR